MNGKGTIEFRAFAGTLNHYKLMHHLWSVFSIVHNAKRNLNNTNYRWEQKSTRGTESLKWFYHHLGKNYFLPIFKNNFRKMRVKAEELATQYDARGWHVYVWERGRATCPLSNFFKKNKSFSWLI